MDIAIQYTSQPHLSINRHSGSTSVPNDNFKYSYVASAACQKV